MKIVRPQSATSKALISVVIPCYNYGHFLPDAVAGVLAQPGVDVEIIIVDDASPDGSVQIARELEAADSRITVVAHEANQGHIATYNDGLKRVLGDYVVLLSADDILAPGSLGRSAALMQAHPEVGLVYGYAPSFESHAPVARTRVRSWTIWEGEEWVQRICTRGTNLIVNPEAMIRRDVMDHLVGYDAEHPHAADMLLWMQAAMFGSVGRVNGPDQAFYRVHGNNMHMTDFKGIVADFQGRSGVFEAFFSAYGSQLHNEPKMKAKVRSALARESSRTAAVAFHSGGAYGGAGQRELAALAAGFNDGGAEIRRLAWLPGRGQGQAKGPHPLARKSYLAMDRLRWSMRWRLWRRYGI
ncbi:glycosyltransferase family 2 protein [Arthrobacter livingstonensis]|uniref:Glycosyltransferase family 2 protein n=1 Tax=Arthrobacter livingstonensis TaxID=670078 RepID=A0A2V5LCU9_9MICC|nr:glycosyltransferase family 2 protein [Arthrobacter livingstonensis]PYI68364.1 glycosyltransferase family 2 protein [Arthrobacter livingstonensis]